MKKYCLMLLPLFCVLFISQSVSAKVIYFSDLSGHWGENNVYYVAAAGLIQGYADGSFCPNSNVTRAEFLTMLANDASVDLSAYDKNCSFSDVSPSFWAKKYINWGAENGIVNGYQNNTFLPNQSISRQEMATILYRYTVTYRKLKLPETKTAVSFNDQAQIGAWALNAVQAMQKAGIINGKENNYFDPLNVSTRAESATMLANYLKIFYTDNTSPVLITDIYSNDALVKENTTLLRQDGILMIPARLFFEAADFRLTYFATPQLVVADDMNSDVQFWIGKTGYYSNGVKMTFSTAPCLFNGVTYVPLFEAAAAAGFIAVFHDTGTNAQALTISYCDSPLIRYVNNFYGGAAGTNSVKGNIFLANSDSVSGFLGSVLNGAMNYGSYTTSAGDFYFGNWSGGALNGAGRYITAKGEFFVGTFSAGVKNAGVTYYVDGSSFSGTWTTSTGGAVYPASGTYTDKNGKVYGSDATTWSGGAITVK